MDLLLHRYRIDKSGGGCSKRLRGHPAAHAGVVAAASRARSTTIGRAMRARPRAPTPPRAKRGGPGAADEARGAPAGAFTLRARARVARKVLGVARATGVA